MQQRRTMPARTRLVTAEEFARFPDDDQHYELVEGRVVRMSPPGTRHGALTTRIASLLHQHVDAHHLGTVLTPAGFWLARDPDTVREPDVAFISAERVALSGIPDGFWPGPPDLAVEIRSPDDRLSEIAAKVRDYLARGVRLVWVVDPKKKTVTVHRSKSQPVILEIDDEIDAAEVVPGFACAVRRFFQ
jgi:Uma2 family endonuclease